jgi:hypothetical protein
MLFWEWVYIFVSIFLGGSNMPTHSFWFGFYFFLQLQHTFFTKPSHHSGIRKVNAGGK